MGAGAERGDLFGIKLVPVLAPTCPICRNPWTCNDAHRICCIPCGHMYGRSCLEWWLQSSGTESAKCLMCRQVFERKLIINLHAPGNLWDGCCRIQENLRAKLQEQAVGKEEGDAKVMELTFLLAENDHKWRKLLTQMERKSNDLMASSNAKIILMKEWMDRVAEEKKAESEELMDSLRAKLKEQAARKAEVETKVTELTYLLAEKEQKWRELLAQMERKSNDLMATSNAKIILMKEKMNKIAEEKKAESEELMESLRAKLDEQAAQKAEVDAKVTELTSRLAEKEHKLRELLAQRERKSNELMTTPNANMILMKKIAEEKKAASPAQPPSSLAPTGAVKKRRSRGHLPPISKQSFPHGVLAQRRWQQAGNRLLERTGGAKSQHLTIPKVLAQGADRGGYGAGTSHYLHGGDGVGPSHYPQRMLYPSPLSSWLMKQGRNASHNYRQL